MDLSDADWGLGRQALREWVARDNHTLGPVEKRRGFPGA
jgi:hypothetical protein